MAKAKHNKRVRRLPGGTGGGASSKQRHGRRSVTGAKVHPSRGKVKQSSGRQAGKKPDRKGAKSRAKAPQKRPRGQQASTAKAPRKRTTKGQAPKARRSARRIAPPKPQPKKRTRQPVRPAAKKPKASKQLPKKVQAPPKKPPAKKPPAKKPPAKKPLAKKPPPKKRRPRAQPSERQRGKRKPVPKVTGQISLGGPKKTHDARPGTVKVALGLRPNKDNLKSNYVINKGKPIFTYYHKAANLGMAESNLLRIYEDVRTTVGEPDQLLVRIRQDDGVNFERFRQVVARNAEAAQVAGMVANYRTVENGDGSFDGEIRIPHQDDEEGSFGELIRRFADVSEIPTNII